MSPPPPVWPTALLPSITGPATGSQPQPGYPRAEPFQKTGSDFLIFAQVSLLPSAFNHAGKAYCSEQYSLKCADTLL